jgi:hypothetical protein
MRKVCVKCNGVFQAHFLCPHCGVQLVEMSEHAALFGGGRGPEERARPIGMATRFVAGILFAQGLYYGAMLIGSAFFLIMGEQDGWSSVIGRFFQPGLVLVSAFVGAMLAGSGNPRGLAAGAALGLFHAFVLLGVAFAGGKLPQNPMQFAVFALLPIFGAAGGRFGRYVWPPLSDVSDASTAPADAKKAIKKKKSESIPTAWFRVVGGAALAIGCTVWAGRIREFVIGTSGGAFTVESRIQVQFVTWVIASLAVVIGGIFAGASTRAGVRHGLLVGFVASVGIFVIYAQVIREALPAERFFAQLMNLPEEEGNSPARIGLFLLTNSLALSVLGGWLGATLLPRTLLPQRLDRGSI